MKKVFLGVAASVLGLVSFNTYSDEKIEIVANYAISTKYYEQAEVSSPVLGQFKPDENFLPPLLVTSNKNGFLQFEREGKKAWVLLRNVKTNRAIRLSETCGAMPNEKLPKGAETRGVGEPCVK